MRIVADTREKPRAIVRIMQTFEAEGVEVIRRALPFGDYIDPDRPGVVIDRKQNLLETANCCVQDRARFLREIDRKQNTPILPTMVSTPPNRAEIPTITAATLPV